MNKVNVVNTVLKDLVNSVVMIDVGAHHGGPLDSFAQQGWTIHAFEPDDEKRRFLKQRWDSASNVIIDGQAISNMKKENVPFYRSDVSSGISGLLDFHTSHEQSGTVNTITLKEYFAQHDISQVDFLKVDTEVTT